VVIICKLFKVWTIVISIDIDDVKQNVPILIIIIGQWFEVWTCKEYNHQGGRSNTK